MLLRQSNLKLQEELRDTMKSYGEEKSMLKAHLANLRLDLSELHHDNRTVTTDETGSHISTNTDAQSKRLTDFDGENNRSLQLPTINHLTGPHAKQKKSTRETEVDNQSSKSLRFTTEEETKVGGNRENNSRTFLDNPNWESKQESQKFLELQKNQEVLRNIGRANLKEKRQSLIRLPTISSAKKRNSLWDSGLNVSRPKGKSTEFELHPYVEDAIVVSNRNFLIPSIRDPQRSEIILNGPTKRPVLNKRKVKFTRPRHMGGMKRQTVIPDVTKVEPEGNNSLNTTLADTTLEDNTLGNITFDDDVFKTMMEKLTTAKLSETVTSNTIKKTMNDDSGTTTTDQTPRHHNESQEDECDGDPKLDGAPLPPIKSSYLAKKNLELHDDLNNLRITPVNLITIPKLSLSPENKSCKDSDKTVGTKLSQMSHLTEMRKNMYLRDIDPKKRNKALSDIMFAVRSRMRENEEALRFGQTPRPQDNGYYSDYLTPRAAGSVISSSVDESLTPRWNDSSPRKTKKIKPGHVVKTEKANAKRKSSNTAEVQTYLRKMYRQRKAIDRMAGLNYKVSNFAGHKQLRMVAQQA